MDSHTRREAVEADFRQRLEIDTLARNPRYEPAQLEELLDNIVDIFIHNLKRYAEGLPLDNQVNRTTRYAADQNGGHRLLSTL